MGKARVSTACLRSNRVDRFPSPSGPDRDSLTRQKASHRSISAWKAVLLPDFKRKLGYYHAQTCGGLGNARFRAFLVPSYAPTEHGSLPRLQRTRMRGAV